TRNFIGAKYRDNEYSINYIYLPRTRANSLRIRKNDMAEMAKKILTSFAKWRKGLCEKTEVRKRNTNSWEPCGLCTTELLPELMTIVDSLTLEN
uniref:Uncharacterized protein n=1 Tax=Romanomermis culicivorax TaxID=13658 RepID=A0A915K420_ROMCU